MPLKSTISNNTLTYQLIFSHEDVLAIINDPSVGFVDSEGNALLVGENQKFEIVVQKVDGTEIGLPLELTKSNYLNIRFVQKKKEADIIELGPLDVGDASSSSSNSTSPTRTPTPTATRTPTPTATKTPTSTPAATATPTLSCQFIECGGTGFYADCGLLPEPGYSYHVDCSLCECVKSPTPTPTPTLTEASPAPTATISPATPTPTSSVTAQFTIQPSSITTTAGSNVGFEFTFVMTNSPYNSPSAVWQYSTDGNAWTDVSGNDGISMVTPGVVNGFLNFSSVSIGLNGRYYRVRCYDPRDGYDVTSNVVNLFVS